MKFLNLLARSWWSLPALAHDFSLPDRQLLRALARRQHQPPNGTSLSELRALGLDESPHEPLHIRQTTTGRCGANYGRCPDSLCCSEYGYCGDTVDHCYPGFDCQPAYGVCGWPRPVATTSTTTTSTTVRSTSSTSTTTTSITSTRSSTSASSFVPIPTGIITTNGQCGNSTICPGITDAGWGPCCSRFFWCGSGPEYCGAGCQSAFGLCEDDSGSPGTTSPSTSTSTSTPSTTTSTRTSTSTSAGPTYTLPPGQVPSTDGRCGNGQNCLGSAYGRCCSQFGWCGDGDQFCPYIVGCQPEFGYCDPQPATF
ncbi:carbohydrate-binding module family 18 protein [Neurospora crassa]|uniref:Chitin-binding type-1 domain-containing protein n=1 Tax=Neurospora crassa (strain ATCC 24698 / 74-OR23-1A / CBS 708.71 / DSM 1257 / FGSC 987) TaxID=367110 RepID=V5IQD8_NEUCR|nr:hypothetical protein NCU16303 [Neurospora crassa OR74A]ESA43749.1 hypothetical protein NCU16303 [Neurospora crassa OR74A]KHE80629.1 carbohydrate-binding module family 18 protein [Neurospora crassa]|eukprot:XP_011393324.1 hypothetical protein NCU16303 [Neurospora crassa OR74A]